MNLASNVSDPAILTQLQTYQGEFFVASSAGLIYILFRNENQRREVIEHSWRQSKHRWQLVEQALDGIFISDDFGRYVFGMPSDRIDPIGLTGPILKHGIIFWNKRESNLIPKL